MSAPPMMMPTTINGNWPILLPEHRAIRAEWSSPEGWERERLDSMHANLLPGDVVYDVGAEEGDFAGLFAQWVGPAGGVVLFEPNDRVWPNMKAIFEANRLGLPLGWFLGFASDHDEYQRDYQGIPLASSFAPGGVDWPAVADGPIIGDHGFKSLVESGDSLPNIKIDTVATLTRPPSAITIDVEGAELEVLYGADVVLREQRPLVWVSVHPTMLGYDYSKNPEDVHTYLARRGYRMQLLAADHENHWFYWPEERSAEVVLPEATIR